jgi:hypothetical protein
MDPSNLQHIWVRMSLLHGYDDDINYVVPKQQWDYVTISKPCCDRCAIRVRDLHLYYWPDQGAGNASVVDSEVKPGAPQRRSYVDESGFTL